MRIARFMLSGRPTVVVDAGDGFMDIGAILEKRGYSSETSGVDPERRLVRMLKRGLLDPDFLQEQIQWAKRAGFKAGVNTAGLVPLLPLRPSKIVGMARNWKTHAQEGGHRLPDRPIFFAKTENCAIGPEVPIKVPNELGRVDHEGELGVVISRKAVAVKAEEADKFILGYLIVNDVTARDLQHALAADGYPWFQAKSRDTFAPLGPWIVTAEQMHPLQDKRIRVTVSGEVRQQGKLGEMHFSVPEIIAAVSAQVALFPGDVVACGTPAGVGPLKPGDTVKVAIEGIGELANPVETA